VRDMRTSGRGGGNGTTKPRVQNEMATTMVLELTRQMDPKANLRDAYRVYS
jgi:hypothetical protein